MSGPFVDLPAVPLALVRSFMFVPGNRPDFIRGALRHGADGIILDLQDSVPEAEEPRARDNIRGIETAWGHLAHLPGRPYLSVRTNPYTRGLDVVRADVAAAIDARVDGILLPEITSVEQLETFDRIVAELQRGEGSQRRVELVVLIETPEAVDLVDSIAAARTRSPVAGLVYGREDLTDHLGLPVRYQVGWQEPGSLLARMRVIWAAKRARIAVLDSIPAKIGDEEVLAWESSFAKSLGFTGRACVHPSQVAGIDRAFSLSDEERATAERALVDYDGARAAGRALTVSGGAMVDRPIANLYRASMERARQHGTFDQWKSTWRSAP